MITEADDQERWPITDDDRRQAVAALMAIVQGDDTPLAIRACRVLIQMDAANVVWEKIENESIRGRIEKMIQERSRMTES